MLSIFQGFSAWLQGSGIRANGEVEGHLVVENIQRITVKAVAKMVSDPKKLPILLAIPAVIFLVVGMLLKMVRIDWLNFRAHRRSLVAGR